MVFTDARQKIEPDAVRLLVENFADPQVGCVSGELMLGDPDSGRSSQGMGLYWRIEKKVRRLESASGSVVGATGALYAVRRELLVPVPPETILDDVLHPDAGGARREARGVRSAGAGLGRARPGDWPGVCAQSANAERQLPAVAVGPWLLSRENPIRFEFVSHKLLRLVVPFALLASLAACAFVPRPLYRGAFLLQVAFYALSSGRTGADEGRAGGAVGRRCLYVRRIEHGGGGGFCEFCDGEEGGLDALMRKASRVQPGRQAGQP